MEYAEHDQPDERRQAGPVRRAPAAPDGTAQVVFYDSGVGTEGGWTSRIWGGAFGKGINKDIEDAYRFLMLNYEPGDDIFLFGFSRGAFTARSTAGLLRNSGLLRKPHAARFKDALDLYRRPDAHPDSDEAQRFRQAYAQEVEIAFIGVWDTVGALGVPGFRGLRFRKKLYAFHDVELSGRVRRGYQALALDERRKPFAPSIWEAKPKDGQVVEQVWFAGVHSAVGGGNRDTGLSGVAFLWMKEKAESGGLAFDDEAVQAFVRPDPLGSLHDNGPWRYAPVKHVRHPGHQAAPTEIPPAEPGLTEAVHPAVVTRQQANSPPYGPATLRTRQPHRVPGRAVLPGGRDGVGDDGDRRCPERCRRRTGWREAGTLGGGGAVGAFLLSVCSGGNSCRSSGCTRVRMASPISRSWSSPSNRSKKPNVQTFSRLWAYNSSTSRLASSSTCTQRLVANTSLRCRVKRRSFWEMERHGRLHQGTWCSPKTSRDRATLRASWETYPAFPPKSPSRSNQQYSWETCRGPWR